MSTGKQSRNKSFLALAIIMSVLALLCAGKLFLDAVYVPAILMYHSIGEEDAAALDGYGSKLNVRPETFSKQMKFLKDKGYKIISLDELIRRVDKGEKVPHKTAAITFDDGLRNNFINAYPVLKKYGFPATIFVATDFVGKENFLTWDDIRTMQKGNISIGNHTVSHRWLPSLDDDSLRRELVDSKEILERMISGRVKVLSYPLGGFDERARALAKDAGYIGAVATNPGWGYPKNDIYALKRVRISMTSDNLFVFWVETSGYYTFIKEIRDED
ncbi:MAG: hypothetical protein A2Z72_00835 [Omnitrophica bacterium RBG_13_46_9]|nr:MAG: hypothetical protein A2Z72_00835 [Omnitrophica bacterium RBG_13_46_9]